MHVLMDDEDIIKGIEGGRVMIICLTRNADDLSSLEMATNFLNLR